MLKTGLPNNKAKPFGGAYSVHDKEQVEYLNELIQNYSNYSTDINYTKHSFFDTYLEWMASTHDLVGFDKYTECCFTNGTTESFTNFYLRYKDTKRLRLIKGDYFYHKMTQKLYFQEPDNFAWFHDDDLREGDILVISCPFSDSGDLYPDLESILITCDNKNIPVMLDLAYINIAKNFSINLDHKCIEYLVSSLSKAFPLETHRVGIRIQKTKFEDPLYVVNEDGYNYFNHMSIYLGNFMMQEFPANYIVNKYEQAQEYWCNKLDVKPSKCVIFGIDTKGLFQEYSRGLKNNRLCFSRVWDGRMTID